MSSIDQSIDLHALDGLRSLFLERMPDFGDFSDRVGRYWNYERAYKEQVAELVRAQLPPSLFEGSASANAALIVVATRRTLTGRIRSVGESPPATQNLVSWRYQDFLRRLDSNEMGRFADAMSDLLYGQASEAERV